MYAPFANVPVAVARVMANLLLALRMERSDGKRSVRTVRVRCRSAGVRCSTFVGVMGAQGMMASSGQPMSSSTSATATRALQRRFHFCVGLRAL